LRFNKYIYLGPDVPTKKEEFEFIVWQSDQDAYGFSGIYIYCIFIYKIELFFWFASEMKIELNYFLLRPKVLCTVDAVYS
jgi:hypothetical protein